MEPPIRFRPHWEDKPDYCHCPFVADTKTIFREMIAAELRAERLTPLRRARMVRYASQLGISASEAGRLIAECHQETRELSKESNAAVSPHPLAGTPPRDFAVSSVMAITTGIVLVLIWFLR